MDLIEVLWKQDVDLGFSVENATPKLEKLDPEKSSAVDATTSVDNDDLEKIKTLKAINENKIKVSTFSRFLKRFYLFCNYRKNQKMKLTTIHGQA